MAAESRVGSTRRDAAASLAESYPISLIVPVHNGGRDLDSCLEAIRANDLRSVEVIAVDDGSTDDTPARLAGLSERWPEFQLLSLPTAAGPAAARNAGVGATCRPYLFFVDADVILPPAAVRAVRETLDLYSHRPEVVGVLGVYSADIPDGGFWSQYKNLYTCYLYATTTTVTPWVHTPVFCIRRNELEELGSFDPLLRRAEDFRLGLRLAAAGKRVVIDRRLTAVHLKSYTAMSLLTEDWRRVRQLRGLRLTPEEKRLARGAHRGRRLLAVTLPLPMALAAAAAFWWPVWALMAGLLAMVFIVAQWPFVRYVGRRRGWGFAVRAGVFSWVEMAWAQLALLSSPFASRSRRGGVPTTGC